MRGVGRAVAVRQAWLHSLGAARQALAAAHEIGEEDMGEEELEIFDERSAALARIHLLGWLQQLRFWFWLWQQLLRQLRVLLCVGSWLSM